MSILLCQHDEGLAGFLLLFIKDCFAATTCSAEGMQFLLQERFALWICAPICELKCSLPFHPNDEDYI